MLQTRWQSAHVKLAPEESAQPAGAGGIHRGISALNGWLDCRLRENEPDVRNVNNGK